MLSIGKAARQLLAYAYDIRVQSNDPTLPLLLKDDCQQFDDF